VDNCTCGLPENWIAFPEKPEYEISDHGRVRSWVYGDPRLLTLQKNHARGGYPQFRLGFVSRNYKPHVEVMRLFVGPRPEGLDIRHLDGNVDNAHIANLRYGTRAENTRDTLEHGNHNHARKTHCKRGHEFTDENTYRDKKNRRYCRICVRAAGRASYARVGKTHRRPEGWTDRA
jgi:hypothetical protein